MSETYPSNEQNTRFDVNTRVDSAHGTPGSEIPPTPDPPLDLLKAIAGQDAAQAELQRQGQALELASILQEKQRNLDQRESELNAKTAQLESEIRHGQIGRRQKTPLDAGIDLSGGSSGPDTDVGDKEDAVERESAGERDNACGKTVDQLQKETVQRWRDMLKLAERVSTPLEAPAAEPAPEIDPAPGPAQVESEPAQVQAGESSPLFSELDLPMTEIETLSTDVQPPGTEAVYVETIAVEPEVETVVVDLQTPADVGAPPEVEPPEVQRPPHIFRMPSPEDSAELERRQFEQQRQTLLQRKEKLDARQQHVERMHEQVTTLHREALELQLSTEQLWSELTENFPSEELARRLSVTRNRLAEHFRITSENLAHRTDELHQLRQELNEQESKLRQKRREIQMWADRRYDEIEMRTAELICRERELDRLEMEFDRQSLQWQQQRQAYRQEIERLSVHLQGQ